MHIVKNIALASLLVLVGYGASYAQANPQPKTVVTKVKVKPPKQIKNKGVRKAQNKPVLTKNEKTIQKANQKSIQQQRNAFRKSNEKNAADFKAMQKTQARNLREQQRQAKKSR